MLCQDCGKELVENAKFCIQCGYPVLEREVAVTENKETKKCDPGKVPLYEDCS